MLGPDVDHLGVTFEDCENKEVDKHGFLANNLSVIEEIGAELAFPLGLKICQVEC
jgi:hypothetical protein